MGLEWGGAGRGSGHGDAQWSLKLIFKLKYWRKRTTRDKVLPPKCFGCSRKGTSHLCTTMPGPKWGVSEHHHSSQLQGPVIDPNHIPPSTESRLDGQYYNLRQVRIMPNHVSLLDILCCRHMPSRNQDIPVQTHFSRPIEKWVHSNSLDQIQLQVSEAKDSTIIYYVFAGLQGTWAINCIVVNIGEVELNMLALGFFIHVLLMSAVRSYSKL